MAFNIVKFIKGILISEEGTNSPKEIAIIPSGTSNTKTTITSSQTVNRTVTIPDATDTLVAKNTTDLLTNKSLQDTTTAIVDNLDPTKQIKFDAEGAPMTTTLIVSAPTVNRTLSLPDATDTLVGRNTTDTLTNKTLTAPVVNTPDINLGTIDGTAINDSPIGQLTPAAGSFTDLSGNSIEVAGDPVVTLDATQTLTNKTLTAPSINNPVVSGGSINDTQIGNLVPDTGAFTTLDADSLETTGDVIIGGNLTVNGTTTTINTQTLDVEDSNITVNVNGNDASAEGAGLTVNRTGTDGSLIYKDLSPSKFAVGPLGAEDNVVAQTIVQTLSNKNLVDLNTAIVNSVDPTKQIKFDAAGTTATSTTLLSSQTTNKTLTLPDATDTLVARATAETLSNKTLEFLRQSVLTDAVTTGALATIATPVNGVIRLTNASLTTISGIAAGLSGQSVIIENVTGNSVDILDDDAGATVGARIFTGTAATVTLNANASLLLTYDSTNQHWMLIGGTGSGSGSGGEVNFIENGNAEQTASPFEFYTSSVIGPRPAGTQTPFVGTLSLARSLVSPLAGDASWILSKNNLNGQGNNVSIPFIVDPAYKAKSIKISMDYRVLSGTFTPGSNLGTVQDSSIIVYIYDVDADMYIEPSNFRLLSNNTTIADHFEAEFQTNASSTNYRLLFHVASTLSIQFSVALDNISVSPNEYVFGTPISDWISYTPTTAGFGTITNADFSYKRLGDAIQVRARFTTGTSAATIAAVSLPNGWVIDPLKVPTLRPSGVSFRSVANANSMTTVIINGTNTTIAFSNSVVSQAGNPFTPANANAFVGSGEIFSFETGLIPISGLSSSVQTSDQTSTRVVAATAYNVTNASRPANQPLDFNIVAIDTHGAITTGAAWKFAAPAPGVYKVGISGIARDVSGGNVHIYKNNVISPVVLVSFPSTGIRTGASTDIYLNTGDFIDIRPDGTYNLILGQISVSRISGPSVVAATEVVAASYFLTASQALTANVTTTLYDTREYDTHNAYNPANGRFTAPVSGFYFVGTYHNGNAVSTTVIFKNGVSYKTIGLVVPGGSLNMGQGTLYLLAGEFIEIRAAQSITISGAALNNGGATLSIHKINGVN